MELSDGKETYHGNGSRQLGLLLGVAGLGVAGLGVAGLGSTGLVLGLAGLSEHVWSLLSKTVIEHFASKFF